MGGESGGLCQSWLLLLAACAVLGDWSDCKPSCNCKWISGKKNANCASASLRKIPLLSSEIQVLDLHDNQILSLPKESFSSIGLLNLQKINLKSSQVKELHRDTFKDLRILVEVDLADNYLIEVPKDIFNGNERLRLVSFSGNPLITLISEQFPSLPHLRNLDFHNCRLEYIHPKAFHNLQSLETLDVRKNLLKFLSVIALRLPSMKSVLLSRNPWICDCHLRDFRTWFLSSNLGNENLKCDSPPTIAGSLWSELVDEQMNCAPEVTASTDVIRSDVGSTISFGCFVRGDPIPQVRWYFNGFDASNLTSDHNILVEESDGIFDSSLLTENFFEEKYVKWTNLTLLNVTTKAAGEWVCVCENSLGKSSAKVSIILPQIQTATARTAPALPTVIGVIGGSLGALGLLGFMGAVICWRTRRKPLPLRQSFKDQDKQLLQDSTTGRDRVRCHDEFEMMQQSPSIIEDECRKIAYDQNHIKRECSSGPEFLAPPPEFAITTSQYGNIYISLQVAGINPILERYPDLIGGATLPKPSLTCCKVNYDNMGPRVTATGSSTWSLPGSDGKAASLSLPPPAEFGSL